MSAFWLVVQTLRVPGTRLLDSVCLPVELLSLLGSKMEGENWKVERIRRGMGVLRIKCGKGWKWLEGHEN